MPRPRNREEALKALRATMSEGKPIIGSGAGIGLSAKSVAAGGVDLIILYNSGDYRMHGLGSLAGLMPYDNANDTVVAMGRKILPVVSSVPVLAGVCASDPFRDIPSFLASLKEMGFAGIQNFPTVGLIDAGSEFRIGLEETGMGYDKEVELIREAKKQGLLTTPYVFNVDECEQMVSAGADVIVAHMGLTTGGAIGAKTGKSLDQSVKLVQQIRDKAVGINKDVIVLCHGGPISGPDDAKYVFDNTKGVHGFYGASSMERLPVEEAVAANARRFKQLKLGT